MAWNNRKTKRVFMITLVLTILIAIGAIALMAIIIMNQKKNNVFTTAFAYIIGVLFINGIGCIWFKIFKDRLMWTHALVHTIAFGLIIFGDIEMFKLFGNFNKLLRGYILSLFTLIVYTLEYLLSFHLIIFRPGTSATNKAFRSGIHAFGGSLTFFIAAVDSFVVWRRVSWEVFHNKNNLVVLVFVLQFAFACCIWYLLLNPYFDWRRLRSMSMRKRSRTPSRSSSRIKL